MHESLPAAAFHVPAAQGVMMLEEIVAPGPATKEAPPALETAKRGRGRQGPDRRGWKRRAGQRRQPLALKAEPQSPRKSVALK